MPDELSPAVVTFVTTEHFISQGARSATITEAKGRASVFLSAVSGGLIALGISARPRGLAAGGCWQRSYPATHHRRHFPSAL